MKSIIAQAAGAGRVPAETGINNSHGYTSFMAPFNVHFLIAERIWPTVKAMTTWPVACDKILYGQFCFGCIAPDVDKLSASLTQKETHFFDRTSDYDLMATHRSATFLRQQADFLACPFNELSSDAQAFVMGYLCHLCVDEVSKHMWRRDTWLQFKQLHPGTAFAALDESARQQTRDFPAVARALCAISAPNVIPRIPPHELTMLWQHLLDLSSWCSKNRGIRPGRRAAWLRQSN